MANVMTTLDPASRAAARGWSDLTIRNLFIIPTIAFLIIFNIFPLIYSLGYSFTDFRASANEPANFVGLQNYRELLTDPIIWRNFTVTAKYVIVSVAGQVVVGFGLAHAAQPRHSRSRACVTTLLLLPMMMSMAVVGLFWKLLYDPSWGTDQLRARPRQVRLAVQPRHGALRRRDHRHLDVGALRDAAVAGRPLGGAASTSTRRRRSTAPARCTPSSASRCRWWRRSC